MLDGRFAGAPEEPTRRGIGLARWFGDPATPVGCTLGFAVAGCLVSSWSRLNYDVAWLMTGARRLLGGAALYGPDFVDVNPPLAVYVLTSTVLRIRCPDFGGLWDLPSCSSCRRG